MKKYTKLCNVGPRYQWKNAKTLDVPELGLLRLSGPIDFGFVVCFDAEAPDGRKGSVELTTGLATVYI